MNDFTDRGPFGVGIRAIGGRVPDRVVTNQDLEKTLDTTDAWIDQHIGVRTRRWAAPDEWTSDLGAAALLDACQRAGVAPDTVDLVICGTYTPDRMLPATAIGVMAKAGIHGAPGFDINSGGCPGGTFALDAGARYVASGDYRRVAVVLSDVSSKLMDPEDRSVGVIFGDGAACYLLEPSNPGTGVGPALMRSSPSGYETAFVKQEKRTWADGRPKQSAFGDNFSYMNGREVRDFALEVVPPFVDELCKVNGVELDEVALIVFHQANYRLIGLLMERIGLPAQQTVTNVQDLGNTSGAGLPLALRDAMDTPGRLSSGDVVVLVSFGAGMSHGGLVIRWAGADDFGYLS